MQAEDGLQWLTLKQKAADNIKHTPGPRQQNSRKGQQWTAGIELDSKSFLMVQMF